MMAFEKVGYADGAVELTALSACPESTPRGAVAIYPTFMNLELLVRQVSERE